jgi:phospholipase/carboxylesterase
MVGPSVDGLLDELLARHRLAPGKLALVGFSQGAMIALYVALRRTTALAGTVAYAGALLGAEALGGELRAPCPTLLVHGDADDVVPFAAMGQAAGILGACGVPVRWLRRPGLGHALDDLAIAAGAEFLADVLPAA